MIGARLSKLIWSNSCLGTMLESCFLNVIIEKYIGKPYNLYKKLITKSYLHFCSK